MVADLPLRKVPIDTLLAIHLWLSFGVLVWIGAGYIVWRLI
jgi:hypothetical protein